MERGVTTLDIADDTDAGVDPRAPWGNPIPLMSPLEAAYGDDRVGVDDVDYDVAPDSHGDSPDQQLHSPIPAEYLREIDSLEESLDTESTPEKILGAYEYMPFRPDELVSLSQIRGERNIVTNELKEDILYQGLINPVDVSLVSRELLEEYILFTNKTWGSEATIADYLHLQLPDGRFPLLKSGHSRVTAVTELIAEGKLPPYTQIMAKVSEAKNIFDIIQWQRGENIHSQPRRERTAMALVESYMHGLDSGLWHSEDEFIKVQEEEGREVTKGPLVHALKYAKLVPRIRNFILAGEVPYLAGVEMGATVDVLSEYVARSNGYKNGMKDARLAQDPEALAKVHKVVELELDRICNRITGENLNSTASQKVVQGQRNVWMEAVKLMGQSNGKRAQSALTFEFAEDALDLAILAAQHTLKRELYVTMHKYAGHDISAFFKLQEGILPKEEVQVLLASFNAELERTNVEITALGSLGTAAALYDDDLLGDS